MEYTINIKGRLMDLSTPQVMGILNVTPDSFYSGSRKQTEMEIAQRANQIIEEGGSIIDVGAFSTRPGADEVSEEEEGRRLKFALDIVRREQPDAAVSVDTYRPTLARKCIEEWGADIINDVSEGGITGIANVPLEQRQEEYPEMFRVVGELKVPYILMSVQPTLETMMKGFAKEVQQLRDLGAKDIILDPGFGFGKNLIQNYQIYNEMEKLNVMELPVLVGISRKSMIYKLLGGDTYKYRKFHHVQLLHLIINLIILDEILAKAEAWVEDDVLGSQVTQLLHFSCKALHHRFECRLHRH